MTTTTTDKKPVEVSTEEQARLDEINKAAAERMLRLLESDPQSSLAVSGESWTDRR